MPESESDSSSCYAAWLKLSQMIDQVRRDSGAVTYLGKNNSSAATLYSWHILLEQKKFLVAKTSSNNLTVWGTSIFKLFFPPRFHKDPNNALGQLGKQDLDALKQYLSIFLYER